jgi:hypothetical protein
MSSKLVVPKLLGTPEEQVKVAEHFCALYGIILRIPDPPLFDPRTDSEEMLLTIWLPRRYTMSLERRTLEAWRNFITPPSGYAMLSEIDTSLSQPIHDVQHRTGFYWVAYDAWGDDNRLSPRGCWDYRDKEIKMNPYLDVHPAGTQVLMALGLCPGYAQAMRDGIVPFANLSGLQVKHGINPRAATLFAGIDDERKVLELGIVKAEDVNPLFANPYVRDLQQRAA